MMRNCRFREFTRHISHAVRVVHRNMRIQSGTLYVISQIISAIACPVEGNKRISAHVIMLDLAGMEMSA